MNKAINKPLVIDYYTDILCVWAWIAQRRIDELNQQLSGRIELQYFYVDIFGDIATKMNTQWKEKGGYSGFAAHVQHAASAFEETPVSADIWTEVRPQTSANAHLVLKAVELSYDKSASIDMALALRTAFFTHARNIGNIDTLYALLEENGLDLSIISKSLQNGSAMAALMHDYQKSKQQHIKGSPSYVIDGGRQTLYGNVGYRVLLANIEELLKNPADEASWC